jgi:eukaryotic-like serine/threonine-protein kinase
MVATALHTLCRVQQANLWVRPRQSCRARGCWGCVTVGLAGACWCLRLARARVWVRIARHRIYDDMQVAKGATMICCPSCSSENQPDAAFCVECGSALDLLCAACGVRNSSGSRYCKACGQPLAEKPGGPTPPTRESSTVPRVLGGGRYRVERFLGEGGRKRVYVAHDTRLDRDVALSVVKTDGLDDVGRLRFERETKAMARLGDHPHIVAVYDTGDENGQPYIVSQYVAGGDLESLLRERGQEPLPLDHVLRITDDMCQALEHAHNQAIVHRDLKPGNVWLTSDGGAKLGDFGLAVSLQDTRLSAEGIMVGTVAYMSPEQALGRPPERRADLYSLGVMMYEMVTGRVPFLGDDAVAVVTQHINTAPVAPSWHNPKVPKALESLILRLLAKAPEDRPESAAAVGRIVREIATAAAPIAELAMEPANPLDRLAAGVFVGRVREVDALRSALDDVLAGSGRLVLLVGEPGIGKTRTAEELTTYARLRNAEVLTGRCYESEGAPAYWPWVQIIRAYLQEREADELAAVMGPGAADIAQVVPEVRERLPDLPAPPALEAEQARFRLFDSISTFLRSATTHRPLVLVLDDLHWADKPSLLLLQFVARGLRQGRLLVLATYRDVELSRKHPLSETLAELSREHLSQRIRLRGLGEGDVARFIEITAGKPPPRALVSAVYRQTEGNPFFVNEVVRLLVSEGRLDEVKDVSPADIAIPESVKEVIGRRLDRLSPECNEVLSIAAVIGREFGINVLERVRELSLSLFERLRESGVTVVERVKETGLNLPDKVNELFRDRVLEAIEEATAARIIGEVAHAPGRYSFSHGLIRETLYSELPTTRRVRLHRQVGEILERLYEPAPESHLAELAYHFFEASPGGNVAKAVDYARRAGEHATALVAYEEAAGHYERAMQALDLMDSVDELQRCDLLVALGEAQARAGDTLKAQRTFRQAAELAKQLDEPRRLAHAALWFGGAGLTAGVANKTLIGLLEDALHMLPLADGPLRARLLARLAVELYWSEKRQEGVALGQEALSMARRLGDPVALVDALTARHMALWRPEEVEELLAGGDEIVHLAEAADDVDRLFLGHAWRVHAFLTLGDIESVEREVTLTAALARDLRQPIYRWLVLNWTAMLALLQGRFEDAERNALEAFEIGQRVEPTDAPQAYAVQMLILRREQGRLAELQEVVKGFGRKYPALPAWRCGLAYLHVHCDQHAQARDEFEKLAVRDFGDLPKDIFWPVAIAMLAEVSVELGDESRGRVLYELLCPYAGRNVVTGAGVLCSGSASRTLGRLAALMQRWDEAEGHFENALRMHVRMGARPFLARTQGQYAEMLLRRDSAGDRQKALRLLGEALSIAQEVGMRCAVEEFTALKLRAQGVEGRDTRGSIDTVVLAVQRETPDLAAHAAPDGAVTIMFSDIEGFTTMTERLGDRRMQELLRTHNTIVRRELAAYGGFEVKSYGDGFMLAFVDARNAVRCAVAIQRALEKLNEEQVDTPIRVRVGLHTGRAIRERDDFFGKNVIVAARIAAQARGGEILVSQRFRELAGLDDELLFGPPRDVELKGLTERYVVHEVLWRWK